MIGQLQSIWRSYWQMNGEKRAPLDVRIATQIANRGIYLMAAGLFFAKVTRFKPGPKRSQWLRGTTWTVFFLALANTFIRGRWEAKRQCIAFRNQVNQVPQGEIENKDVTATYEQVTDLLGGKSWKVMHDWCDKTANQNPFPIPENCRPISQIQEELSLDGKRAVVLKGLEAFASWPQNAVEIQSHTRPQAVMALKMLISWWAAGQIWN